MLFELWEKIIMLNQ